MENRLDNLANENLCLELNVERVKLLKKKQSAWHEYNTYDLTSNLDGRSVLLDQIHTIGNELNEIDAKLAHILNSKPDAGAPKNECNGSLTCNDTVGLNATTKALEEAKSNVKKLRVKRIDMQRRAEIDELKYGLERLFKSVSIESKKSKKKRRRIMEDSDESEDEILEPLKKK